MPTSAAHVSTPCSASTASVLGGSPSATQPGRRWSVTDWSDEPEAVRLSPAPKRKEYREHHNAHGDKLGSIMLMVTSGGAIEESYRYKEYGETTVVDDTFTKLGNLSSNINNWKRYTGRERMIGGSLSDPWYHYRARAYRADAGRFVQRDPVGYVDGGNLNCYVSGQPINRTDALGMSGGDPLEDAFWCIVCLWSIAENQASGGSIPIDGEACSHCVMAVLHGAIEFGHGLAQCLQLGVEAEMCLLESMKPRETAVGGGDSGFSGAGATGKW